MAGVEPLQIVRRATYSSVGVIGGRALTAFTVILIARAIGPAAMGLYATVWALMELTVSFSEIGLTTGLKREGSPNPELLPQLMGNALLVRTLAALAMLGVVSLLHSLRTSNGESTAIFLPLAAAAFGVVLSEPMLAVLQIRGRQALTATFLIVRGAAFLAGVVGLAFIRSELTAYAWCHGLVYAGATLLLAGYVLSNTPLRLNIPFIPTQMRRAFVFAGSEMLYAASLNGPLIIMSYLCAREETGQFAVAQRFVILSLAVGAGASQEAFLPALFGFFRHDKEQYAKTYAANERFLTAMGVVGACCLFVFAEPVIIGLQGEAYRPAVLLLRVLCWLVVLSLASFPPDVALTASDNMKSKIAVQSVGLASLLLLASALALRHGALGVSGAVLAAGAIVLALMVFFAHRHRVVPRVALRGTLTRCIITVCVALALVCAAPHSWFVTPVLFAASALVLWSPYLRRELKG